MVMLASPLRTMLSSSTPTVEARLSNKGAAMEVAAIDHVHPSARSSELITLDANSEKVVSFSRTFAMMPCFIPGYIQAANAMPLDIWVKEDSWVMSNGEFVGCTVVGKRNVTLPGVLTSVLGFNPFNGSAAGAKVWVTFAIPTKV